MRGTAARIEACEPAAPARAARRHALRRALGALALLACFGGLVGLAAAKVAHFGLCSADDGYFASVAKNLAMGPGYGATVYGEGFRAFHPEIGAGPTLILPAALGTALLGNRYWTPGAVAVALWATLLLLAYLGLRGRPGVRNLALAAGVFVAGVVLLFPFHFEQWFALLGEVPTALLLLLAAVVAGRAELSTRSVALGAFLCALAFLTKTVSALYCAAFLLALAARTLGGGGGARALGRYALAAGAAFLAPVLAFEAYKLFALGGLDAYRENLSATARFVREQGAPAHGPVDARWRRALEHDRAFALRFGVSVLGVAGATLASSLLLRLRGGPVQRAVALPLAGGVLVACGWYLFFSIGWPRYLVVALVLAWVLVVLALTALPAPAAWALAAALLLGLHAANHEKLAHLAAGLRGGAFERSPELESALALTAFIDANAGTAPFAHQWWATTADLEYYARSVDVFRSYALVGGDRPYWLVIHRAFRYAPDEPFDRVVDRCAPAERSFEPYVLLWCGP